MVKNKISTTTEYSTYDWEKIWFSDETIIGARETLIDSLYIALTPGKNETF